MEMFLVILSWKLRKQIQLQMNENSLTWMKTYNSTEQGIKRENATMQSVKIL